MSSQESSVESDIAASHGGEPLCSRNIGQRSDVESDAPEPLIGLSVLASLCHDLHGDAGDGLNEYDEDYRSFLPLGDIATGEMARTAECPRQPLVAGVSAANAAHDRA